MVVSAVSTQRLLLPIGPVEIPMVLATHYLFVILLFLRGALTLSASRLCFWGIVLVSLVVSVALSFSEGRSSIASFLLLVAAYSPLSVCLLRERSLDRVLSSFSWTMKTFGAIGILQVIGQLLGVAKYDPLAFLPDALLSKTFHNHIKISHDLDYFKADGIVFAEPSFFSQFLAFAVLLEFSRLERGERISWRQLFSLALLLSAMFLTFSGTGVIALTAGLLWQLRHQKPAHLAVTGAAMAACLSAALLSPWGHFFTSRITEFTQQDSSAYRRFVSPYVLGWQATLANETTAIVGHGPGTIDDLDQRDEAAAVDREGVSVVVEEDAYRHFYENVNRNQALSPTVLKCIYEYGVFSAPFLTYLVVCFGRGESPWPVRFALLVSLLVLGGNLLFVPLVAVCHILGTLETTSRPQPGET
jgi:hypothetical protein